MRMSSALKGLALQQGQLPRLCYEDWLLPPSHEAKVAIDEGLLPDAAAYRKLAAEMLRNEVVNCFQEMKKTLERNSQALCNLDSSLKLELTFLDSTADGFLKATVSEKLQEAFWPKAPADFLVWAYIFPGHYQASLRLNDEVTLQKVYGPYTMHNSVGVNSDMYITIYIYICMYMFPLLLRMLAVT